MSEVNTLNGHQVLGGNYEYETQSLRSYKEHKEDEKYKSTITEILKGKKGNLLPEHYEYIKDEYDFDNIPDIIDKRGLLSSGYIELHGKKGDKQKIVTLDSQGKYSCESYGDSPHAGKYVRANMPLSESKLHRERVLSKIQGNKEESSHSRT